LPKPRLTCFWTNAIANGIVDLIRRSVTTASTINGARASPAFVTWCKTHSRTERPRAAGTSAPFRFNGAPRPRPCEFGPLREEARQRIISPEPVAAAAATLSGYLAYGVPTSYKTRGVVALNNDPHTTAGLKGAYARRRRLVCDLSGITGISPRWPKGGISVMLDVSQTGVSPDDFAESLLQLSMSPPPRRKHSAQPRGRICESTLAPPTPNC
jgi:hypothetical protein